MNKIKLTKKGFTIVELLVVIVVIGILAAITVVSYTGVSSRAKGSAAVSNANSVSQVASTYAAENSGSFPTQAQLVAYNSVTKIPTGVTVSATPLAAVITSSNASENTIVYLNKSTTGACIGYWDFAVSSPTMKYIFLGDASAASLNVTTGPTCT
ncbi:MAG: prepilin-type N-terminal cleavage/methylation domain-containing protein [Candidatus Saccharimonadales bacterium]